MSSFEDAPLIETYYNTFSIVTGGWLGKPATSRARLAKEYTLRCACETHKAAINFGLDHALGRDALHAAKYLLLKIPL